MSYFEDQEDAWFENNCQGDISDVDPYDPDWKPKSNAVSRIIAPKRTKSQKRRAQRKAAERRAKAEKGTA